MDKTYSLLLEYYPLDDPNTSDYYVRLGYEYSSVSTVAA
jgi:hypothetical protein